MTNRGPSVSHCDNPEMLTATQLRDKIAELESVIDGLHQTTAPVFYRKFFERYADSILILQNTRFIDCNDKSLELFGYENTAALLQAHPSDISPEYQPDGRRSEDAANEMIGLAVKNGSHRFDWEHARADGSVFPAEVVLTYIDVDEQPTVHAVVRDVSRRKQLEDELRQAQKMEAIGKLTGGIAHDFNNFLVALMGYADLLEMELDDESPLQEYVEQIQLASGRSAQLVAQLLAYSRKQVLTPVVLDLNELVQRTSQLMGPLLGADIEFTVRVADQPARVKADAGQLEQVILNLATNARDAMAYKGQLCLECETVDVPVGKTLEGSDLKPGAYVCLSLTDTGGGIDPVHLPRIFDPFFTTKALNKGTGLGLSTCYGIIKQSGGDIVVHSRWGTGTTFKVYLPISNDAQTEDEINPKRKAQTIAPSNETIVLVDDDLSVARLNEEILKRNGYTVYRASGGQEALELIDSMDQPPNLLLTDVIMPNIGGPELAETLRRKYPGLKVLFASGYTDDALIDQGALQKGVQLIQKPFTAAALIDRIRQVLDADST